MLLNQCSIKAAPIPMPRASWPFPANKENTPKMHIFHHDHRFVSSLKEHGQECHHESERPNIAYLIRRSQSRLKGYQSKQHYYQDTFGI